MQLREGGGGTEPDFFHRFACSHMLNKAWVAIESLQGEEREWAVRSLLNDVADFSEEFVRCPLLQWAIQMSQGDRSTAKIYTYAPII